jgi:hypothetical protein
MGYFSNIFLRGTSVSKLILKSACWYDRDSNFSGAGQFSKPAIWVSWSLNIFLFQELSMNKFKLTWGLMLGIFPTTKTRPNVWPGQKHGGFMGHLIFRVMARRQEGPKVPEWDPAECQVMEEPRRAGSWRRHKRDCLNSEEKTRTRIRLVKEKRLVVVLLGFYM